MAVGIIVDEYVSSVSLERLWKAYIVDGDNLMPKILPNLISSVEYLEGDGGVGTIKKLNFTEEVKGSKYIKNIVEVIDSEKHIYKYNTFEGGMIGTQMKSYVAELSFTSTGEGRCLAQAKIDYETLEDGLVPSEEEINGIKQAHLAALKAVEGYLSANPSAYA